MIYPEKLKKGETIGICCPSSGVTDVFSLRLDHAIEQLNDFSFVETNSVRENKKLVSTTKEMRAKEFLSLYLDNEVKAIMPPWGGELLMDILPLLDYKKIKSSKPKWVSGFSDLSTLLFVLTVKCDIATIHAPNLLDFGATPICKSDLRLFDILTSREGITQESLPMYQKEWTDVFLDPYCPYKLTEVSTWKSLKEDQHTFKGRLIGGCIDTICKLFGTPYAPITDFTDKYRNDGIIWYFEFLEMNTTDIYKTLLQMKYSGYFKYTTGILIGRSENEIVQDFNFIDALQGLNDLNLPILYDVDLGHMPPQLTFVNGALAEVSYHNQHGKITQWFEI